MGRGTSVLLTFDNKDAMLSSVDTSAESAPVPRNPPADILQGTLDLLILKTLSLSPMHGWGVSQRIGQISREVLQVNQGSLYPALHRLERDRYLSSFWQTSESGRRAKFYRLTDTGRRALERELKSWRRFAGAVELILRTT